MVGHSSNYLKIKRLATVCARGGSKGLPGKNLRPLLGSSLVERAVFQALDTKLFDLVVVSSDEHDILNEGRSAGAGLVLERPAHLASDTASKMSAIQHAVHKAESNFGSHFETIVDLDATSPLRSLEDIKGAVTLLEENQVSSVITGSLARKIPYFNMVEINDAGYVVLSKPTSPVIERRQDCPPCYDMNAAVYVWRREMFMQNPMVFYPDTMIYVMPEQRSYDIDTALDFEFVELVMKKHLIESASN